MKKNLLNDSLFLEKKEILTESHRSLILERLSNLFYGKKPKNKYAKLIEFVKNLSLEELVCLYNNVIKRELAIKIDPFDLIKYGREGYYNFDENLIQYIWVKDFIHEFIHLASSNIKITDGIIYKSSGFARIIGADSKVYFGVGLTEGYTDLLMYRILNKKISSDSAYFNLVKITRLIELFFEDKNDLRKMFFTNDINSFIEYMSKYLGKENVFILLESMDFIIDKSKKNSKEEKEEKINSLVTDLSTILISTVKDKSVLLELKDILETSELKEETTLKLLK